MPESPVWADEADGLGSTTAGEAEALEVCADGRAEGLERLYERHKYAVFRTCLRIMGDRASAEDATHEVFLRVFERASSFSGQSAFGTWLYRITVNHCLNLLDKRRRRPASRLEEGADRPDASTGPFDACASNELRHRILRLLGELSVDHRTVLTLREIEDLSYAEIAEVLDIPEGTVMSRLTRAREALRKLWLAEEKR